MHFAKVSVLGWAGGDSRSVNNWLLEAPSRLLGAFLAPLGCLLGGPHGASWGLLGASSGFSGQSEGDFLQSQAVIGRLGCVEARLEATWGPIEAILEGSRASRTILRSQSLLGPPWGRLGVLLSRRERLWRRLPTLLGRLGALLEAS